MLVMHQWPCTLLWSKANPVFPCFNNFKTEYPFVFLQWATLQHFYTSKTGWAVTFYKGLILYMSFKELLKCKKREHTHYKNRLNTIAWGKKKKTSKSVHVVSLISRFHIMFVAVFMCEVICVTAKVFITGWSSGPSLTFL